MDFCRFLSPSASSCLTEQRHIGFRCYTDLLCGSSNWHFVKSFSAFSPSRSSNNGSCAIPSASFPGCIGVVKKIIAGDTGLSVNMYIPLVETPLNLFPAQLVHMYAAMRQRVCACNPILASGKPPEPESLPTQTCIDGLLLQRVKKSDLSCVVSTFATRVVRFSFDQEHESILMKFDLCSSIALSVTLYI